jgi:hypothetical protein
MYTYPCAGTGGDTEYATIAYSNGTKLAEAHGNGYTGDWRSYNPFGVCGRKRRAAYGLDTGDTAVGTVIQE